MPSSHPIANFRRWLTTPKKKKKKKAKTHQAPIQQGPNKDVDTGLVKRASFQSDTHLAKPEPALHRLQELKSPPPIPPPLTGPDSTGFKSRPLYRRTHSSPANPAEGGMPSTEVTATNLTPSGPAVMVSASKEPSARRLGHKHEDGGYAMDTGKESRSYDGDSDSGVGGSDVGGEGSGSKSGHSGRGQGGPGGGGWF